MVPGREGFGRDPSPPLPSNGESAGSGRGLRRNRRIKRLPDIAFSSSLGLGKSRRIGTKAGSLSPNS